MATKYYYEHNKIQTTADLSPEVLEQQLEMYTSSSLDSNAVDAVANSVSADAYEPDDTASNATRITPGTTQTHSLTAGDFDMVYFTVTTAGTYTIETTGSGDTVMGLFDASGELIEMNDDISSTNRNSRVSRSLSAGTYYVGVMCYDDTATISSYGITLTAPASSGSGSGDTYEPDDEPNYASQITAGSTQTHSLTAGDTDWVYFTVTSAGTYTIETTGSGDTKMTLYQLNGQSLTQLATNDDISSSDRNARISRSLSSGTYFAEVTAYSSSTAISSYGIKLTAPASSGSGSGDMYEPDDEPNYASQITAGSTQTHSLTAGDTDWVYFTVTSAGTYTIETTGSGDTKMTLYQLNGQSLTQLATNDDISSSNRNARISRSLSSGTYFAEVTGYSSSTAISSYGIKLTASSGSGSTTTVSADSYEGDNSRFTAKTIAVGATQNRSIHSASDVDWVKFTVANDGFYSIETSGADTILELYSLEGQYFVRSDDKGNGDVGSRAVAQLYANTSYYAKVSSYGSKTFNYTLSLSSGIVADTFESNSDNSRTSTTTTLEVGREQDHTIHTASDVDWMKVSITQAGAYIFTVFTSDRDAGKMNLEVYNSSGSKIGSQAGTNPYSYLNLSSGTYYVKVGSATSGVASGMYKVAVSQSDLSNVEYDSYENDDRLDEASVLSMSSSQTSVTQTKKLSPYSMGGKNMADADWSRFTPAVTGVYSFSVSGTAAFSSIDIWSYAADDDGILLPIANSTGVNPYVESELIAGQTYFVVVSSDYPALYVPSYTLTATRKSTYTATQDTYENDNTASAASVLTIGNTQVHSLHNTTDEDWMKFTPSSTGYYTFYTGARNGTAGDGDIMMGLYDAEGKLLVYDDDSFTGYNAMLSYQLNAGSTYYLRALSARENQLVPHYTVSVASGIVEDTYDVYVDERSTLDNDFDNAILLELDSVQSHSIHSASDVDYVGFWVENTGYYTIQTEGSGDTIITLFDENREFLYINDDGGVGRNAALTLQLQAGAIYYAEVSSYQNSLIPNYTLSLTRASGGSGDAYESDNTYATAKGIVAGDTQSRSIHTAGDVDWVKFRPIQSGAYQIQTSGDGDLKLDLYAANGTTLLASDDDSGVGLNARIGYNLNANTDYYIKAYTYDSNVLIDEYALGVSLLVDSELGDEYENDNNPTNAKSISVGQTQTHSIHTAGDVDWVTFTPTVSAEYTIQTVGSGLNCDTQLYLYTSLANAQANSYLQWDDDSGSDRNAMISRVLTAGTTYYIKAKAWETYTIPSYGLKVTQNNGSGSASPINGDEYENDNASGNCKPIAVGREYTHSIHVQSDTDWVRFFTHQTGTYTIQTTGDSDMSFIVYKREPGGPLVPYENGAEIMSGGVGNNASYRVHLETNNWYYVRITTSGRQTTSNNYGIRVDIDSSSVRGDAYETAGGKSNDNAASRATWLTANSAQVHSIHTPGDQDWFAFKSTVAAKYTLELSHLGLYVYQYKSNADGTLTYISRTGAIGTDNTASVSVDANSTYYFKITASSPTATISAYTIGMSLPLDIYEDDNTSSKASILTLGERHSHSLHNGEDKDWVKFTVSAAGNYEIQNNSSGAVNMVLYKNNGTSNVEVGRSSGTKIYNNLSAGTYYVLMSSVTNSPCDGYSVKVSRINTTQADAYENDNSRASAKTITLSSTQKHSLHTTSDVDYVKFYATAGRSYTVSTIGDNLGLKIENSSGNTLKTSTGNNASAYFTPTSSGYYYARISSANATTVEEYSVKVEEENSQENYVVLFNGGGDYQLNHPQYYFALWYTYETLVNDLGIKPENIYIVAADGVSEDVDMRVLFDEGKTNSYGQLLVYEGYMNSDYSFATEEGAPTPLSATSENLARVFNEIAGKMDSNDHFLFWATDHGSDALNSDRNFYNQGSEVICGWGNDVITGPEFNEMANVLRNGYQTFIFGTCFSGGILNSLDVTATSTRKRWGAAAAAQGEFGWGAPTREIIWETQDGLNIWAGSCDYVTSFTDGLANNVNTTQRMGQYLRNNDPYGCDNSYTNNNVCSEHYNRDYYDMVYGDGSSWTESDKCGHSWSKGSDFQIFAQA